MREPVKVYTTKVTGLANSRHEIFLDGELQGSLTLKRNPLALVVGGEYKPAKRGGILLFRREPGLLRGQFSLWSEKHEWLGSSVRFHFFNRLTEVSMGGKPYKMLPLPGISRGWSLNAPKTGVSAKCTLGMVDRDATIEVYRRTDYGLLLFAYFLGAQFPMEGVLPGPRPAEEGAKGAVASGA